jgi:hypothetical protein
MTTLSSLNTSNIGRPEISLTAIKLPDMLSVMLNNDPDVPRKATLPDCNVSKRMLLAALPEN